MAENQESKFDMLIELPYFMLMSYHGINLDFNDSPGECTKYCLQKNHKQV